MSNSLRRWHAAAFGVYGVMAVILIDHGKSLTTNIAGHGADPLLFIWLLAWWPFAVLHHLDPLYTNLVWQPLGVYLPWVTSVPLLSLLGAPVTWAGGPLLTYNLLIIGAPVVSAWAAYRLCLKLTGSPAASIISGYLFGFSTYEMAQNEAALNLSVNLFVPFLLIIVSKRLDDELSRRGVIVAGGLLLIGQFMISAEIFAMLFVFGGLTWALALLYMPERRSQLRRLFIDGLCTAPLVVICLSPFLLTMFSHFGYIHLPQAWPYYFTIDPLSLLIPSPANAIGGDMFRFVSKGFVKFSLQEQDGYLGVPLLLIIFLYARENAGKPAARMLVVLFLLLLIASFGPHLWLDGHYTSIGLPWGLPVLSPLIGSALPARFSMFVSLAAAIMAAIWISAAPTPVQQKRRLALGVLACIALLPRFHVWEPVPHSRFFQPGRVQAALGDHARLLLLPFAINGPSSFWQQEAGFSFAQTGGYLGFPPHAMQHYKAVGELFGNYQDPGFVRDFRDFCAATNTQYVVAGPGTPAALNAALARLNWPSHRIDDVTVYTVPSALGGAANG
jgi:hypothetical protein